MRGGILARLITRLNNQNNVAAVWSDTHQALGSVALSCPRSAIFPQKELPHAIAWQASHNVPSVCVRQVGHWRPNTNTSHTAAAANTQRITLMSVGIILLLNKSDYSQVGFPKGHSPSQNWKGNVWDCPSLSPSSKLGFISKFPVQAAAGVACGYSSRTIVAGRYQRLGNIVFVMGCQFVVVIGWLVNAHYNHKFSNPYYLSYLGEVWVSVTIGGRPKPYPWLQKQKSHHWCDKCLAAIDQYAESA